ncbi:MAG: hypothetical protein C0401_06505 [Anaerolinea sp.]|nr:hypothetical protein [Anaerolinea sp.]
MTEISGEVASNSRKCKCARCKRELAKGEGIQHRYLMFHGSGQFYYYCLNCDVIVNKEVARLAAALDAQKGKHG